MSRKPERTRPPAGATPLIPHVEQLTIGGGGDENTETGAEPSGSTSDSATVLPDSRTTELPEFEPPKYLQLARRDLRLREDQIDDLAVLRRRITGRRRRGERGERITDNTLVRVAIDLLLAHAEHLDGTTEDQLRESAIHAAGRRRRRPPNPAAAAGGTDTGGASTSQRTRT